MNPYIKDNPILGDLTRWQLVVYYIGRHSKLFRLCYYRLTKKRWLWGVYQFIQDNYGE